MVISKQKSMFGRKSESVNRKRQHTDSKLQYSFQSSSMLSIGLMTPRW